MKQPRQGFQLTRYLFIAISLLISVELAHFCLADLSLQTASRFAARYGVTGEFNNDYCQMDCPRGSEDRDRARLQSIKDAALHGFHKYSKFALMNTLPESDLQIVICSDREGIEFNESTGACSPDQDPGDDGGRLYLNLTYPYPIGSSLGLNLGQVKLSSSTESRQECFKMGCLSSFQVRFTEKSPAWYVIDISAADGRYRFIDCPEESIIDTENLIFHHDECTTNGVWFDSFNPAEIEITVTWNGGSITETVKPRYRLFRPNGFRCEPTCLHGEYVVDLQE